MAEATCAHIEAITTVKHPKRRQCDECVKSARTGSTCERARSAARHIVATTRRTGTPPSTRGQANIP